MRKKKCLTPESLEEANEAVTSQKRLTAKHKEIELVLEVRGKVLTGENFNRTEQTYDNWGNGNKPDDQGEGANRVGKKKNVSTYKRR